MNFHSTKPLSGLPLGKPAAFVSRRDRRQHRFDAAFAKARAKGATVTAGVEQGFAAQGGTFGAVNFLKQDVEVLLRDGTSNHARLNYHALAERLPPSIDGAIVEAARDLASAKSHLQTMMAHGFDTDHARRRFRSLRAALLALRWMRAAGHGEEWPSIRDALRELPPMVAALRGARREFGWSV